MGCCVCTSFFFHTALNCMILGGPKIFQRKLHSKDWTFLAYHWLLKYMFHQYSKAHHFGCPWDFPIFPDFMKLQTLELDWRFIFWLSTLRFSFCLECSPQEMRKWKNKESNFMRQTSKLYTHTPFFFYMIVTFEASTLFCLSRRKISLVDQELPVSLLSLKRPAEHFAAGNLRACSKVLELLTFYCPNCQVIKKCGAMRCIGSISTRAGPPNFFTQHSCIL